jgi:hypothetical protein
MAEGQNHTHTCIPKIDSLNENLFVSSHPLSVMGLVHLILTILPAILATSPNNNINKLSRTDTEMARRDSVDSPRATINCTYFWRKNRWSADYLDYSVRITPTGRSGPGWCDAIELYVEDECKVSIEVKKCDEQYKPVEAIGPGLDMRWRMRHWKDGEDNKACVKKGILEGSCSPLDCSFIQEACYKRENEDVC